MAFPRSLARRRRASGRAQRGIALAITLISLVLLLVGLAAMLRNVDTSSIVVGNLAFRRDLTNRAEAAILTAKTALATGTLGTADLAASNYSSFKLTSTNNNIPDVLVKDSTYPTGYVCVPACGTTGTDGTSLRWVIDRQCVATGVFDTASCEYVNTSGDTGGSNFLKKPTGSSRPIYRISVKITGPRGAEAFFQTTYAD